MTFSKRFLADESGATAIEYGLIAVLITVVALGAMSLMGGNVDKMFQKIAKAFPS